jgi:putative membrane protein
MLAFNYLLASTGFGSGDLGRHDQQRRIDAKPNDTDGTISDEPASIKGTADAAESLTGVRFTEPARRRMGLAGHHAFGAAVGGLYGVAAWRRPVVTSGRGLLYGAAVWLCAVEVGLPAARLSRQPRSYPPSRHLASLGSHLVFGLALEATRCATVRAWRSAEVAATVDGE